MKNLIPLVRVPLAALVFLIINVLTAQGGTNVVTTTAESGAGSLRQAILDANADASPDLVTIAFNIPGAGVQTIAPLSGLPAITRPVTIDGYTQPGASPNTLAAADNAVVLIELSGTNTAGASGLSLTTSAGNSAVRGLVINRFNVGIAVDTSGSNVFEGNFLGTDATGTNVLPNADGILIQGGDGNRVGGLTPASRNIIGGNTYDGISLVGCVSNQVLGNFVGVGADGATTVPQSDGIFLQGCSQTQIGGPTSAARNVISGNTVGCNFSAGGSNVIQGNYIGTDASGILSRGNYYGVAAGSGSSNNLIGGPDARAGNLISGNGSGVVVQGASERNNVVAGNLIGTDVTGTNALGNIYYGVLIYGPSGNVIGGTNPGARNVISGNGYPGVVVLGADATNNAVLGNSIFANGGLGIDLGVSVFGMTPNDPGDGDEGPNHFQNFPEIASATLVGGNLTVRYRVDSAVANSAYPLTVEFFLADSMASGQGRTFIHRHTYDTAQTFTNITFTPAATVNNGDPLVATATDANGNTSEFSAAAIATANHPPVVQHSIPDQSGSRGYAFSYTFSADTFREPDAGDTLTYTASGLAPGLAFDGPTRTFSGTPGAAGTFTVTVTATDNGTPPLSASDAFDLTVLRAPLTVTNLSDSGPGTLRQVIADAEPGSRIDFAVTGTIALSGGEFAIDKGLTLAGPGPMNLLIRGQYASRVFNVSAGPTKISGVTLSGGNTHNFNITDPEGGAIRNSAHLTLDTCAVVGNGSLGYGGAVWSSGESATLVAVNCTFANNVAGYAFTGNEAGGAIWSDGTLRVTNCTFSGNGATLGGAVYASGDAVIASSTITGSGGSLNGWSTRGGIFNDAGALALLNSIVAGNHGSDVAGGITAGDYNLIQDTNGLAAPGTHNVLGQDALLSPLRDNGGPTLTHGLASISPALDAADGATCPATDQRGVVRPQGAGFDIGAVEGALPLNHAPFVAIPIPDQHAAYGDTFSFTVPAEAFGDPDAGQALTYDSSTRLPCCVNIFSPETRSFYGPLFEAGRFTVTVTATDDGAPPLSTSTTFDIVVSKLRITARADDQCRPYGQPNPPLSITYYGRVDAGDYLDNPPVADTTATPSSPPGTYPITLSGGSDHIYDLVGLTNGTLTVLDISVDYRRVRSFGFTNQIGQNPNANVIEGSDGILYGTTSDVIYSINRDGTGYRLLRSISPAAPLREFSDGALYGTTTEGGTDGFGTIFRLNKDGAGFTILHEFTDDVDDGSYPQTQLLQGSDGLIYGTAREVFRMNSDGTGYTIVHTFSEADGAGLTAPLIEGTDGALYGATQYYGPLGGGTLFKVNKDGSDFEVLHAFATGTYYFELQAPLGVIEGRDGALYGMTRGDGDTLAGVVFKINKDGSGYSVLHTFADIHDGKLPKGTLIEASDGTLYGVTSAGSAIGPSFFGAGDGIIFKMKKDGTGYSIVLDLDGSIGSGPVGTLEGSDGKLYSACFSGANQFGTILRVNKDGSGASVLWSFSATGGDVYDPNTTLIEATNGRLYGGTYFYDYSARTYSGTGFSLNKDGSDPAVVPFSASRGLIQGSDGKLYGFGSVYDSVPYLSYLSRANLDGSDSAILFNFTFLDAVTSVNEGTDGKLYGTAARGSGGGGLFKINKDGTGFVVLRQFEFDSSSFTHPPHSPEYVFEASDGNLYGICGGGGGSYLENQGSVFRVDRDGNGYTNLLIFAGASGNASEPNGRLIEGSDGRLYGTTYQGGGYYGAGTLFGLNKDGSGYAVLRSFEATLDDVEYPNGVTEARDGYLYGFRTGYDGGRFDLPTPASIFRLKKDGTEYCLLHRFSAAPGEEKFPMGWPLQGSDGAIYGAARGGASGFGAVFRLALQPVTANPPPALRVEQTSGGMISVSWSPASPGFVLQANGTLDPNTWADAPSGGTNPVSLSSGAGTSFFRLRKP